MPRIYYRSNKIYGKPFVNEKITTGVFNKIIAKSSFIPPDALHIFELPQKVSPLPWKKKDKGFRYAVVWNTERYHNTNEYGDFYLPRAIVFFDVKDSYFPSDYYFVVNINNKLEISHCRAGIDTAWFQQPELRRDLTDAKTIKRFEKSISELIELLEK